MNKIKIGGGYYALSYIFGFETKHDFIDNAPCPSRHDREAYLSDIWDLAHRGNDFKTAENTNDGADIVADEPITENDTPVVVKPTRKREQSAKKE